MCRSVVYLQAFKLTHFQILVTRHAEGLELKILLPHNIFFNLAQLGPIKLVTPNKVSAK